MKGIPEVRSGVALRVTTLYQGIGLRWWRCLTGSSMVDTSNEVAEHGLYDIFLTEGKKSKILFGALTFRKNGRNLMLT